MRAEPNRRMFLRGAGVALALPYLEAFAPPVRAAEPAPRRAMFICRGLGLYGPDFFPASPGRSYALSPYLNSLAKFRRDFTVISGLSHPHAGGGHAAEASFLTGAPGAGTPNFRNTISIDQVCAAQVGNATRYPFLSLATHMDGMSVTGNGVSVPPHRQPLQVFNKLFVDGTAEEVRALEEQLARSKSILDSVREDLSSLEAKLGAADRQSLEQYTAAVREVEKRLANSRQWMNKAKPRVDAAPPKNWPDSEDIVGRSRLMFELMHLALQTDSTRVVSLLMGFQGTSGIPPIEGVEEERHALSHHALDPVKIEQLRLVERAEMQVLAELLRKLQVTRDGDGWLLDNTIVLYGSNMGNASSHDTKNVPILLAGGGFKHGQYLAFNARRNPPLCNLYVSILQKFGVETDQFGTSTSSLTGLDA